MHMRPTCCTASRIWSFNESAALAACRGHNHMKSYNNHMVYKVPVFSKSLLIFPSFSWWVVFLGQVIMVGWSFSSVYIFCFDFWVRKSWPKGTRWNRSGSGWRQRAWSGCWTFQPAFHKIGQPVPNVSLIITTRPTGARVPLPPLATPPLTKR